MIHMFRRMTSLSGVAAAAVVLSSLAGVSSARAQFYKLHNADVAVGGTGQFTKPLTSDGTTSFGTNSQYTTDSAGFVGSLREHPVSWAGVEVNYGYTHFSEKYTFNQSGSSSLYGVNLPGGMHEATGAYMFHPHFLHLQPFVNVGGGGLYFNPRQAPAEWRGAGLLEAGFDLPTRNQHFGFRVQGRSLYYRAPNFNTPEISTRSWVVTTEPSLSAYIRF